MAHGSASVLNTTFCWPFFSNVSVSSLLEAHTCDSSTEQ